MCVPVQARYGTGTGAVVAMGIPLIAMFFCGASSVTSNSRWGIAPVLDAQRPPL